MASGCCRLDHRGGSGLALEQSTQNCCACLARWWDFNLDCGRYSFLRASTFTGVRCSQSSRRCVQLCLAYSRIRFLSGRCSTSAAGIHGDLLCRRNSARRTLGPHARSNLRANGLVLPPLLVIVMGFRYFSAKPFLAAAIPITVAGVSMTIPVLRITNR